MKTYTLQTVQTGSDPLVALAFLDVHEIVFTKKPYFRAEEPSGWVIHKDVDLVHSIDFDYPVKNFKLFYDDTILFQSSGLVTKVDFPTPLNTNTYFRFRFTFDHASELFDSGCLDASGGLPTQLKPSPLMKCSVLTSENRTFLQGDFTLNAEISEVTKLGGATIKTRKTGSISYKSVFTR